MLRLMLVLDVVVEAVLMLLLGLRLALVFLFHLLMRVLLPQRDVRALVLLFHLPAGLQHDVLLFPDPNILVSALLFHLPAARLGEDGSSFFDGLVQVVVVHFVAGGCTTAGSCGACALSNTSGCGGGAGGAGGGCPAF